MTDKQDSNIMIIRKPTEGFGEKHEKVWISVHKNAGAEEIAGDLAAYMTEGEYYVEQGVPCISYHESMLSGMNSTTTTIRLEEDKVSLIRLGYVNSLMEFQAGKQSSSFYETPYGDLLMQIYTHKTDVDYDENHTPRKVSLEYDLMLGRQDFDFNSLEIEIRSTEKTNH